MNRQTIDRFFWMVGALMVIAVAITFYTYLWEDSSTYIAHKGVLDAADDQTNSTNARRHDPAPRRNSGVKPASLSDVPAIVQKPTATSIIGRVVQEDDTPLEGVTIQSLLYFPHGELNFGLLSQHTAETSTDAKGEFVLTVPGHGAYKVSTWHPLFAPTLHAKVRAGSTLTIRLKQGGTIHGKVFHAQTKKPIVGAQVQSRDDKSAFIRKTTTDEEGRYKLMGLHPRSMQLSVTAKQLLSVVKEHVVLNTVAPVTLNIELSMGKVIKGIVLGDKKQPVADALIKASSQETRTDELGEFTLAGFTAAKQNLEVTAEGFLSNWRAVNMEGSRTEAKVEIVLSRGLTIHGLVLDSEGKAAPGASVQAYETWGGGSMAALHSNRFQTLTDEEGRFSISGLSKNSWSGYLIRATKDGFAAATSKKISLSNKPNTGPITLMLTQGGRIRGRVFNDKQSIIAGAKVTLKQIEVWFGSSDKEQLTTVLTDENGRYTFGLLSRGKYAVDAFAPDFANTRIETLLDIAGSELIDNADIVLMKAHAIRGTVTKNDGTPLEEASISIRTARSRGKATTDAEGKYQVSGLGEGPYTATATCSGFVKNNKKDTYGSGGIIDFEMKQDGYVLGRVLDAITDDPITTFKVTLQGIQELGGRRRARTTTRRFEAEDGVFQFHAPDGQYNMTVSTRTHTQLETLKVVVVEGQDPLETVVHLHAGGAIEGWVTDSQGKPLPGINILLRDTLTDDGIFRPRGTTESDGYFYCSSLKEGTYDVAYRSWDLFPLMIDHGVSVNAGELTECNLNALPPSNVTLVLQTPENFKVKWFSGEIRSMRGAPLELKNQRSGQYQVSQSRRIGLRGQTRKTLRWLSEGPYELTISQSAINPVKLRFYVDGAGPILVEVPIVPKNGSFNRSGSGRR